MLKKLLTLITVLYLSAGSLSAQKFEAETAVLTVDAAVIPCASCSGDSAVNSKEGTLTFTIPITTAGSYNMYLYVASPYGPKDNNIVVDGNSSSFHLEMDSVYKKLQVITAMNLTAGNHVIQMTKSWGWIHIDYLELEYVSPAGKFNINTTLVNINPTQEAGCLYQFLYDNYTKKILSGVMTLNSFDESNWLKTNTGKEPVVLGLDLMHTNRGYTWYDNQTPVNDAKAWSAKNGIPIISWHWRDPLRNSENFYSRTTAKPDSLTTDFDVSKINDPSSPEYMAMLKDIDFTAGLFKNLQDNNVPILWRPLHEAAGGWFWWGAKDGASCKKLWQVMYDRMVNYHGLHNLIWIWTYEPKEDSTWYPGDAYVDIVGRDIYKDGDHGSQSIEFNNMNARYQGKKMITLSETGSFPDVDNLVADQAGWSWYMPWYGDYTESSTYNSLDLWKKMFASPYVLTLDEMPDLKNYCSNTGVKETSTKQSFLIYPTLIKDHLTIKGMEQIETVVIRNLIGAVVKQQKNQENEVVVSFSGLNTGIYFVTVNNSKTVKVIKY